jgi:hypothetical protein
MGNKQKEGVHYNLDELYALVKSVEECLFMTIVAQHGLKVFTGKSDTSRHSSTERKEKNKYTPELLIGGLNQFRRGMLSCS